MRISYDEKADAMYIRFSEDKYYESEEVKDGVILDYDKAGKVIALDVLDTAVNLPGIAMSSINFEILKPKLKASSN